MKVDPDHETPSYLEKVQSQLPALQLLTEMGWEYLTPEECVALRGERLGGVVLEPLLIEHIRKHCSYEFKGKEHRFTENAIANAVQPLKAFRATGATHQNEEVYDLLCLGTSVPQTVDGDTKSFSIAYIDWKQPENNSYHCTVEFKVERIGQQKHYIPDIVLFVNGIPVVVIECKRSAYRDEKKQPVDLAIDQLAEYQRKEGIPQLFLYGQLLVALARDKAEYGTTGTGRKFWTVWKEAGLEDVVAGLIAQPVPPNSKLLTGPFALEADAFRKMHEQGRTVSAQDLCLYGLCRPERLLELIYGFVVYDNGQKKVARYQQYFAVKDIVQRALSSKDDEDRAGGVVWHTQGSGKSLTMVMLAKALALAPGVANPKIILVTDRIDLDNQICGTFRACGLEPEQAGTGEHLVELLMDNKAHVVTTVINKFIAAASNRKLKSADRNTFVLVDEGHRSNYSEHHARMKMALKGACFIAFTGTPLAKGVKLNTFVKFGPLFQPAYTIAQAVADKAVTPLLYEARHVPQPVDKSAIDGWFERLTSGLSDAQRADLKRKFASEGQLNRAAQRVRMIAWDVSLHYSTFYQGTGMKGQLVAPNKATALLYKKFFDEFGKVSTEVLISGPNSREGEDDAREASSEEKTFWQSMMDRYGSDSKYNKQLINSFKKGETPEIIIVVDKLLTGFDAPCNAVLYLARKLSGHTLLQAIARVNRLFEGKDYGLILDYSGVIEELDEAIDFYTQLAEYDKDDLIDTVTFIEDHAAKLPGIHGNLWDLFQEVRGSLDPEVFEMHLRDEERRHRFYERLSLFARTLSLALASTTFLEKTSAKTINTYKKDLKFFENLRAAVSVRFQERVNYAEYEQRIRKLIDAHVGAEEAQTLMKPINLFDASERKQVLEDQGKSTEAKADMIASATMHTIEKEMEKDPAFYSKFSKMLESVLDALYHKRLQALEALEKIRDIASKVATHTDDSVPAALVANDMGRRYYGILAEDIVPLCGGSPDAAVKMAVAIPERIKQHVVRDWRDNIDALNKMRGAIDDVLFEISEETGVQIPLEVQDRLIDRSIEIAIANED
jgi:type I restriction enzyme R subunit